MSFAPRILFVMRRFWPLANDHVWRVLQMASELQLAGWKPEILTAQWHSAWPPHVELREFEVHRLPPSPSTPFRSRRYARNLTDWIARSGGTYDAIVVDAIDDDALSLTATKSFDGPPVIVRYDALENSRPLHERTHTRVVTACHSAAQLIVPHDHARRELVAAGIAASRIEVIPDFIPPRRVVDERARSAARRALADINHELFLRADDRLIVCPTELNKFAGLELLILAIGPILEARRDLRCWIVGEGPERGRAYELLRKEGWHHDILMPGTFEDVDTVLSAADLCILPGSVQGLSWLIPAAVTRDLTTIFCDSDAARARFGSGVERLTFSHGNTLELRSKIESWLSDPTSFQSPTRTIADRLLSNQRSIETWRQLLGRLERMRK